MASEKTSAGRTKKKATARKTAKKRTVTKRPVAERGKRLRIRQVKSGVGSPGRVRRTLIALGLRHHQAETTVPDNASTHGMLRKVHHLVRVVGEEE